MSIHKLTAGSGYDYLTRQVAAQDATERGHSGLASYYSAKGEAPGVWVGDGMAALQGLAAGDPVTEEQMRALFGSGRHPLAAQLRDAAADAGLDPRAQERATWLGTPYKVYSDVSQFRRRVAQRVSAAQRGTRAAGRRAGAPWRTAPGSAPRSPWSCSGTSSGVTPGMPARSPRPSPGIRVRAPPRSPGST